MSRIGFVGMGNMAMAIAEGFIRSGKADKSELYAYAPNQDKLRKNAERIGFTPVEDVQALVEAVDLVMIACKPYQIDDVIGRIRDVVDHKALISIAAGWTYESYVAKLPSTVRIQCIMPNTPAMVGEGVMLFEDRNSLNKEELAYIQDMFAALGIVEVLPTHLMGIGGAISGCGPAYMDLIIEAYADAAVKYGITRETAYRLVSQTMLGSARLQLETGNQPGVLKDAVCSPAGTTIRGVEALEHGGLRAACMDSINAVMDMKSGK